MTDIRPKNLPSVTAPVAGDRLLLDGTTARSIDVADFFASNTNQLFKANNLSELADKKAAQDNLSIHGADVASGATINLESATGDLVDVTGTTTITAITLSEGHERTVRFTGALTLTNGASLVLPGGANITTAAGDFAIFRGYAAGVVRCVSYSPISGAPLTATAAVATFLHTPSSANLRSALTDETGTGAAVFATSPSLTTPLITGITSGSTPASGLVGELVTATASGVSVPTNTPKTITSITVSAGFYLVVGNATVHANGSNALTEIHACLSDTTNALMGNPYGAPHAIHTAFIDGQDAIFPTGVAFWNFATSKTIYLVTNLKYTTGGTMTADGTITAVRLV